MNLFDPERPTYPRIGHDDQGQPKLIHPRLGVPCGQVPNLYIRPDYWSGHRPIRWAVWAHVLVSPGTFRTLEAYIDGADMALFAQEWLDDPEGTLTKRFGFTWPWEEAGTRPPGRPRTQVPITPTLEDLGI